MNYRNRGPTIHEPSTIGFQIFDEPEIIGNLYEHPHLLTNSQGTQ